MPFSWPHSARRWLIQWWRLAAGSPQNPHDHGTLTLVLRLHLCRADLRICPSWSGHVVLLISMSSGVCQASSSLVLGLLWMIVWLAFLIHCDLPELKYFQNGAHRRSSAFVFASYRIYNVSTTNTLSTLIQRMFLHYLSGFQRKISVGGQIIWWIWDSIAR